MKSQAIRNAARGEACTLQIAGICNHDAETTVLAHLRIFGGGGIGLKPSDLCAAFACSRCHDYIDGRYRPLAGQVVDIDWYIARAIWRTHERLVALGVLTVKGAK